MRFLRSTPSAQPADRAGDLAAERRPETGSFPSIWVGSFADEAAWNAGAVERDAAFAVFDAIDDRLMSSRHPFDLRGWCSSCQAVRPMAVAWHLGHVNPAGSVNPAWTANGCCHECGLVSRMRALIDFLRSFPRPVGSAFTAERLTRGYDALERMFPGIVGSEFLGDDHEPGREYPHESGIHIRHEDMTALSLPDRHFDLVVTQDVFEHIPDYATAFVECKRVLRPGGRLVFTIPFFANQGSTEVRAVVGRDGAVTHLLPPEIHGNPVGDGSLCFQHFGWDLLDTLRQSGFAEARAHMYWGPWAVHLGYPVFVFEARR
jgi:SAM-dependent methyltransferase